MKKSLVILSSAAITLLAASCSKSSGDSDETTGNWVRRSAFDGKIRGFAASFVIGDSAVYIGTGYNYAEVTSARSYNDLWEYRPGIDSWELQAALPTTVVTGRSGAVGFAVNGKGYIGLGQDYLNNPLNDFYQYTPATNTWKSISSPAGFADGRYQAVAFAIKDTAYVGTGSNTGGSYRDFYKYDSNTDTWTAIESIPGDKRSGAVSFNYADTAGYVVTGINTGGGSSGVTDFAYYKPADGHWHSLRPIYNFSSDSYDDDYTDIARTNAAIMKIGNYAYLSTGSTSAASGVVNKTWMYDIKNDQWTRRTPFDKTGRYGAIGFSFAGRGFIALGSSSTSAQLDDVTEFLPNETTDAND